MTTIHNIVAHGASGLRGVQTGQRDWSPFVAHFTTWSAMQEIRRAISGTEPAGRIAELLDGADERSAATAEKIGASGRLLARSPSEKDDIPACVCLSECSLPGLLGHCERYGRFGWVFRKATVYGLGARPCNYVSVSAYTELAKIGRGRPAGDPLGKLFGLSNVYTPPGHGKVQDYTHEREWRLFDELDLATTPAEILIAPQRYATRMREWFPASPHLVPIDVLHEWGL